MVIEGGKLVPATAYDAERLDSYRRGTKVNVVMVRDGGRVMERKWFAVLGLVVRQCNVPWKNKDQASEAVKLALGIVNLSKTVGGDFMAYPKSLVELTDPELDEAVRDMMDLIQKMTGIDPATLKKEIADVGEDEIEDPSEVVAPSSDGQGSDDEPAQPKPSVVAADPIEPAEAADLEAGAIEADHPDTAVPASDIIAQADRDWLKLVAKMLWAATGLNESDVLKNQMGAIREHLTPDTIGKAARAKANSINAKCKLVCFGEASAADALPLIAGIAGCDVKDITT